MEMRLLVPPIEKTTHTPEELGRQVGEELAHPADGADR